jgi:haloalkane dehalogenase
MDLLRTPDDRFADLPGYPFAPHYVDIPIDAAGEGTGDTGTLRVHHLDEGPADGEVVLLMHGEPSWSFLYRHMIPVLTAAGLRCISPDLVGFGRSDKPSQQDDYTYARHVAWMRAALFDALDLTGITLVCQDWGSLIGLRLLGEHPERFARVVVGNGGMPTGDQTLSEAFLAWQNFAREAPEFPIGAIINGGCTTDLSAEVIAGYDAPFPDNTYTAGARIFPALVPTSPDDPAAAANKAAWETLQHFERPFLTAFSDADPITKGGFAVFQKLVPGTKGRDHVTIEGGGHFLQEDRGPELAKVVADLIASTPVG